MSTAELILHRRRIGSPDHRLAAGVSRGLPWLATVVVGGWCLALSLDTVARGLIPLGSLLRMGVPLVFLAAAASVPAPRRLSAPPAISFGVLAIAVGGVLSSLQSAAPLLGLIKLGLYLAVLYPLVLSGAIAQQFAPGTRGIKLLVAAMLGTLGLCVLFTPLAFGRGVFLNPNSLGLFCLVAAPPILYLLDDIRPLRKGWGTTALVVLVLLVLASHGRGSAVGLAATVCTYYGLWRSASVRSILSVGLVLLALGSLVMMLSDSARETAVQFAYKDGDALLDEARQLKLAETLEHFWESPLLGYGFGLSWLVDAHSTGAALSSGRLSTMVGEFGSSTLAMLAGGGLVVTAAFALLIGGVFAAGLQMLRRTPPGTPIRRYLLALLAGLAGLLVNAQSEAWLMAPLTWSTIAFWLYCGMVLHVALTQRPAVLTPRVYSPRPASARAGRCQALSENFKKPEARGKWL